MKNFGTYEFSGTIMPGLTLLLGVWLAIPDFAEIFMPAIPSGDSVIRTAGVVLFVLIFAYVIGHFIQIIGSVLEKGFWRLCGGMPTDWVIDRNKEVFSSGLMIALESEIKAKFGWLPQPFFTQRTPIREWWEIVRLIQAFLVAKECTDRVDKFQANYGMFRGLTVSFLALAAIAGCYCNWLIAGAYGTGMIVSLIRMRYFAMAYGKELFFAFLALSASQSPFETNLTSSCSRSNANS